VLRLLAALVLSTTLPSSGVTLPGSEAAQVGTPVPVSISGYGGDAMEPFVTPGGELFFNDLNQAGTDTDLLRAKEVDTTTFTYQGAIGGVNTPSLDAVPSMDSAHDFYLISTRSYARTGSTVYGGTYRHGTVTGVSPVTGLAAPGPGLFDFDADVSPDGRTLILSEGKGSPSGQLKRATLVIAARTRTGFSLLADSARLLAAVNLPGALDYAAAISADGLDLYFTRAPAPAGTGSPSIYLARRNSASAAFGPPVPLSALTGFVEAPSLSPDGRGLYFHRLVGNTYGIWYAPFAPH
jgi:hypothetical protein